MLSAIKIKSVWDLISLSILIAPYMGIYEILDGNLELFIGLFLCLTIEKNVKRLTHKWYPPIFKRPDDATDCSILNDGGPVGDRGGFPSASWLPPPPSLKPPLIKFACSGVSP